jgi:CAAX prenyl protease-like protein
MQQDETPGARYNGYGHFLPFAVFMVLTFVQDKGPWEWFPAAIYALKTVITGALLWKFRRFYTELSCKFHWSAVVSGLVVNWVWIGSDHLYKHQGQGGFDPTVVSNGALRAATVFFRLAGAVIVVPIMEELFYRSWMARWIIKPDFTAVKVGAFTWPSLLITTGIFTLGHHHWLPAIFAGLVFHAHVLWSKRLNEAVVSHAVANLALGIYVLKTQRWEFW